MPEAIPTTRGPARPRIRSAVTTILLIALSIMIVKDLFARRWGSAAPSFPKMTPSPEVTRPSP